MFIIKQVRGNALAAAALLGGLAMASEAHAITILTFGQSVDGNFVAATETGSSTTISAANTAINITQIDSATVPNGTSGFLNLTATNTDAATSVVLGGTTYVEQDYSGMFTITSGMNGTGTNFLSGSFADLTLGTGSAASLTASQPGNTVSFTSSVIPDLGSPRAVSFSFANVTPALSITNGTISSFTSSVSGTLSAAAIPTTVPEPASLTLLGVSLLGLGMIRRHRRS